MARYRSWDYVADIIDKDYGGYVDYEEKFYICIECGEPIYECDYGRIDDGMLCPVCEFTEED
jgi:formylmethanofuran dehydrogenase subunit E